MSKELTIGLAYGLLASYHAATLHEYRDLVPVGVHLTIGGIHLITVFSRKRPTHDESPELDSFSDD